MNRHFMLFVLVKMYLEVVKGKGWEKDWGKGKGRGGEEEVLCWMRVGKEREQRCTKRQKRRKRGKASCGPVSASGKHTIKCPFNRESSRSAWGGHHRSLESRGIVELVPMNTMHLLLTSDGRKKIQRDVALGRIDIHVRTSPATGFGFH